GSVSACQTDIQSTENHKRDGMKSYEEFEATIKAFPYQASQSRKDRIIKNYNKLEVGMSKEQVADLIGEPDFSQLDYDLKRKDRKAIWLGSSWNYYLYKRENLVNVYDPYLYVRFGTDDRAKHFGPVNIEGLTEKS